MLMCVKFFSNIQRLKSFKTHVVEQQNVFQRSNLEELILFFPFDKFRTYVEQYALQLNHMSSENAYFLTTIVTYLRNTVFWRDNTVSFEFRAIISIFGHVCAAPQSLESGIVGQKALFLKYVYFYIKLELLTIIQ